MRNLLIWAQEGTLRTEASPLRCLRVWEPGGFDDPKKKGVVTSANIGKMCKFGDAGVSIGRSLRPDTNYESSLVLCLA